MSNAVISFSFDMQFARTLNELEDRFKLEGKGEVLRHAVALLVAASGLTDERDRLVVLNDGRTLYLQLGPHTGPQPEEDSVSLKPV